ncbi:MAG TPA: DoxX family protein [Ktedonobacteraceae bacterium]
MTLSLNLGFLLLRLVCGLTMAAHGSQKLFGWFGGSGFAKQSSGFQSQGLKPGWFWAGLAILGEVGGGLSLAFGFLTPLGAAGIFASMFMAIFKAHWKNGFWNGKRGIEYNLVLLTIATTFGLTGPGSFSLDGLFGLQLPIPWLFLILAACGVLLDIVGLLLLRSAEASQASPPVPAS